MIASSPSIWFDDGNIVVIAEDTAFKVHRGQLARHSEVFEGLFSLPHLPGPPDEFDGCQSVQMHGDAARDWRCFLGALYDGLYFKSPRQNDFPLVSSVLRLSTKYLVEPLRSHCLARLEIDYPQTLEGWDRREAEATDDNGYYSPREQYSHPIPIIHLCLELGLIHFLPAAFYDLSRYGPSKIVEGFKKGDQLFTLSLPIVARVLRGRELAQESLAHFVLLQRSPSEICLSPSVCIQAFYCITLNLLRAIGGLAAGRDADPLFTLLQAIDMLDREDYETATGQQGKCLNICVNCKIMYTEECYKARCEAWKSVPEWFDMRMDDVKDSEAP